MQVTGMAWRTGIQSGIQEGLITERRGKGGELKSRTRGVVAGGVVVGGDGGGRGWWREGVGGGRTVEE